jgi:chemotaxis protein MotB
MARRHRHEEHENHERWLVSYADFITLLFAFFTVLYATSDADVKKQHEFEKSVRTQFAGFGSGIDGDAMSPFGNADPRNRRLIVPIEGFPPTGASAGEVRNAVENRLEKDMDQDERETSVGGLRHDTVGVRIELAASKFFATGSADIRTTSIAALDKVARIVKDSNRKVIIEGHTDDQPIHTTEFPSNWELSAARATKIVRYLILRHQIPASRLTAVAYAEQKPIVPNDSDANRAKNRRIEILIVTGETSL